MPAKARAVNQRIEGCPCFTTISAARTGPRDEPRLPPIWKSDWAKPCRSPAARWATREASGWKIAEPIPIMTAEPRIMP